MIAVVSRPVSVSVPVSYGSPQALYTRPRRRTRTLLAHIVCIVSSIAALGGCVNGSGQVVSRLPPTDALAPPAAPHTLPAASVQQQRYDALDKRALDASENAQAVQNAAKLLPTPTTNIYNGYSRW